MNLAPKGATEKEGKYFCEKCGNDLSAEGSVKFVAHADGVDFFENIYNCAKCKNVLTLRFKRKKYNDVMKGKE